MCPCPSITKPVPVAVADGDGDGPASWLELTPRAVMSTTLGDALAYTPLASSNELWLEPCDAETGWSTTLVTLVEPPSAPTAASSAVTSAAPSTAAATTASSRR